MSKNKNPLTKGSGLSTNVILTAIVAVVAVAVIGGVLWFNRDGGSAPEEPTGPPVAAELLRKPDSNLLVESPESKVTVVEFLDYQCPACWGYYTNMTKQVEADYAGKINFVVRNFPLDMHPLARPAAQAAEAAALQGKFKEMYHAIYDNYEAWGSTPDGQVSSDAAKARGLFEQYAQQAGLDLEKFRADVNSPQVNAKIDADSADGKKAGVEGTPTIFINGRQFKPGDDVQTWEQLNQAFRSKLDAELAK
ncbi:Protein-disulfide isomerase [Saccharopolyspora kobensis]|uniref:Protein-disulfide isomerase n=1 Tax=Saccharopolyspora kobensis TaxID=146035 RepID=A0A1H6C4T3_9PSEU|nr:thioredoxin domain-containing protein [Saccharopolyspora kobensis]SEG68000.1 Protein-disulfide isomerase [Saccharopolyspora kobensis]SFC28341.1 Protein-disulfide isomerase [Saccharopolyspora kobensis]